jgi:hypothetical protein
MKTCPGCHGSGRRAHDEGFHDVTKTKPSHYGPKAAQPGTPGEVKATAPRTSEGIKLGAEIKASATLSEETKVKLTREIIEHESTHGHCTKTFSKKIRKQLRGSPAA